MTKVMRQNEYMRISGKFRKISNRRRQYRRASGLYLIETLVALILGAMFSFALLNMFSETLRLTSSNSNRQDSDLITQSVLDSVKTTIPEAWNVGTTKILVNSESAGERDPYGIHPLPVGLNAGDFTWLPKALGNKFRGDVYLDIQAGTAPESKIFTLSSTWTDSANSQGKKTATFVSLRHRGVNYWQ